MADRLAQNERNERFFRRLLKRRPGKRKHYQAMLKPAASVRAAARGRTLEGTPERVAAHRASILETIVARERPVLFVQDGAFNTTKVATLGFEALELVKLMKSSGGKLLPLLPLIGRFDVKNFPGADYLGTGWFVATDIVVTNRHVASLLATNDAGRFVFRRGVGGASIQSSICNAYEFDDLAPDASRIFAVKEVLYIEPNSGPNDIAFVRVARRSNGVRIPYISVTNADAGDNDPVCVIGYPARASQRLIPDQQLMQELYQGRFDIKRAAPGYSMGTRRGVSEHDCTTLGGNSGSVVLDFEGNAVGLHFAGLYHEANYAVPASVLNNYIRQRVWNRPIPIETPDAKPVARPIAPAPTVATSITTNQAGQVVLTIPLTITVGVGTAVVGAPNAGAGGAGGNGLVTDIARVEQAVKAFWNARPDGVIAVRVGYFDDGDRIGDTPCIAASVTPMKLASVDATGPREFQDVPIRYLPADVDEQVESLPSFESVDSISYDDDARTGAKFSFNPVDEAMTVDLHVGPEYSWEKLKGFLLGDNETATSKKGELVSAMYEFHALHIKNAIQQRLTDGNGSLKLVLDNATFAGEVTDADFHREEVFENWAQDFPGRFKRIVAPEGRTGLISDSYHIKVTVRPDDTFWLSSGNWKAESSQPLITQDQLDNATDVDLPGNREWHVTIKNKTLAERFRSHIAQDFKRSGQLDGGPAPEAPELDEFVDIALEEVELERKPPSRILKPKPLNKPIKVQPLLTPDKEGEIFSKAVLKLIRSANQSLFFQIPYISMPSNPNTDRGFIDELIDALIEKLNGLDKDKAHVILRSGGNGYSSPAHAAWYFKSKGVDIAAQLRSIGNHHTKGMIVDGKKVLIGSHNWSKPGVTLNRDASLIFDDTDVAQYFTEAFEIDWERSNPIKPRKFVKPEAVLLEATGSIPPPGFRRVRVRDLMKDD